VCAVPSLLGKRGPSEYVVAYVKFPPGTPHRGPGLRWTPFMSATLRVFPPGGAAPIAFRSWSVVRYTRNPSPTRPRWPASGST
jgi:hypothetical protein